MSRPAILALIFLTAPHFAFGAKWDVQYWQQLQWKSWESGRWKLYTLGETRLTHDLRWFTYYKISPSIAYRALENLDLELHYSYINVKTVSATAFSNRSRLEIEVNPFYTFKNGIEIKWRNRMEFIKQQKRLHIQYVTRQRLTLKFPLHYCGSLLALKVMDELFYDLARKRYSQNRFYPLILTFALGKEATLDLFLMVRSLFSFSSNKWYRQAALGTTISF